MAQQPQRGRRSQTNLKRAAHIARDGDRHPGPVRLPGIAPDAASLF
jgi:hypothetical protein